MGAAVGENLAAVRAERRQTQREAVAHLRGYGLRWTAGSLAQLESGRRETLRVDELVLLSNAYGVPLARWFEGEGTVDLTDEVRVDRSVLRDFVAGVTDQLDARVRGGALTALQPDLELEVALALALGVTERRVRNAAQRLWERTALAERDARVGALDDVAPRSVQARRGAATRALTNELRAELGRK